MAGKRRITWCGEIGQRDDFGVALTDEFVDGATRMGPWAIMSPESYASHGVGKLGLGIGQRYRLTDGEWVQVEGGSGS